MKTKFFLFIVLSGLFFQSAFAQDKQEYHKRPLHIGLVYPISTNGIEATKIVNNVSLHGIAGLSAGIEGIELTGILSRTNGYVNGVQLSGLINIALADDDSRGTVFMKPAGNVRGIQAAGLVNIAGSGDRAVQVAGIVNKSLGNMSGVQISGIFNSVSGRADGVVQVSGFVNQTGDVTGIQIADFLNKANNVTGVQVSGFINIAQRVEGVQISGFINVADSSDYPIGFLNLIKNGERRIQLRLNELSALNVSFISGSRKTYGILGVGHNLFDNDFLHNLHYGIGFRNRINDRFSVALEGIHSIYANLNESSIVSINESYVLSIGMMCEYRFHDRFSFTAGPVISYISTEHIDIYDSIDNEFWHFYDSKNENYKKAFVGFSGGVYFWLF